MMKKMTFCKFPALTIFMGISGLCLFFAPELSAEEVSGTRSMYDRLKDGGTVMIFLGGCSLAMVGLYVFNSIQLSSGKFIPQKLKNELMEHMQSCRVRSAIDVSAASPTFLGRMMAYALPKIDATDTETLGREKVEDAMADFTVHENRTYMTWIGYLSVIAQVSPMLGLLGTVVGMIESFEALQSTGGSDPSAFAGSISKALITTATGLIIALPSIFGYFFFKNRLNNLVSECHSSAGQMIDASLFTINAEQQMAKVPEGIEFEE